jgi:SsrA-binding protein
LAKKDEVRVLVENRRARFDYALEDTFEAGIALAGSEVKSVRMGKANLQEAWVRLDADGAWLMGCHISPYAEANRFNHEPLRERRLLLNRSELAKLRKQVSIRGRTIVPTRIYLKGSWVKVEIAVATGKKLHDKRHAIKERESKREMARSR